MAAIRLCVLLILGIWLGCGSAHAEKRVALVIGNSAYKNVPRLANPVNDATLVGGMFKKAGFDAVDVKLDQNALEMRRTLRDFAAKARDADIAVIYYAGHGIELDGNNYLIPTDAALETDGDVLDETIPVDRALFAVEPAKQLRLIILDACRDNPFARTMKRTIAARGMGRGLAKVEPASPNTMIAFAAKAGSTASDGDARNSPFATALVEHLPKPGLDLRKAFGFVRDDVLKSTGYKQEPYVYGSLGGDDLPLVPAKPVATGAQPSPESEIRRDYELALQLGTRDGWNAFLARYPNGFYTELARGQLNKIAAEKARQVEQAKGEAAEQQRRAAEAAAKALADKQAADKAAAERQAAADAESKKVAALSPPPTSTPSAAGLARSVQLELRRVGCLAAPAEDDWNLAAQRSLTLFNKYAGTRFDVKIASTDALDAIKTKPSRVCPLVCDHGYKADGDSCVRITCRPGFELGEDNSCKRIETKRAMPPAKQDAQAPESQSKAQSGGGSCSRMKDPLGCNCALKTGGYIFPSPGSYSGYRFRWTNNNAYYSCLYAAGRR